MVDGVFTLPLISDLCLEDFEPACAQNGDTRALPHAAQRVNGDGSSHSNSTGVAAVVAGRHQANYLAGPENRTLVEAVDSLLRESPSPYNPLVLWGPPGTGKSHIALGIARHWRSHDRHVIYTRGADFARGLASAVETKTTAGWSAQQRDTSLFVLEEIAQLVGKRAALNELLHTIDTVQGRQGQVVLTSRLSPERLPGMPAALAARLVGGLVVQLSPPSGAVRLALVQRFAEVRGVSIPAAAARSLADGLAVTAPELFGAVTELSVQCAMDGDPINPERVRAFLADRRGALRPTVRSISVLSAKYFNLKLAELTSPTRRRAVVQARNVAIYLARQLAGKSLQQLGDYFGGRDHTTILHGYRMIEARSRTDPTVRQALSELTKMIAHG
ncbi:MAG: DnaA/Hda family protein [Pirellulales bacterium]